MSDLLPWPLWPLLLPLILVLVLVSGSFCPLCQGQQRLSKSSSAAVDDDDDEGDGNLKQFCLGSLVLQHHLSAARAWQVGSAEQSKGEGEGTCRPCADLTLAKQYKSKKDLAAGCRLIDTSPRLK